MIFIAAANEPTVFLMLTEQDCNNMRGGRTVFVDRRQTGGAMFDRVVLSLHANHEACKAAIRQAGHAVPDSLPEPEPTSTEGRCRGCQGCIKTYLLLEGMCMMCWKEKADHYELLASLKGGK